MSNYFIVRIELKNLSRKNKNAEYNSLYTNLNIKGFHEFYRDDQEVDRELPNGVYAISSAHYNNGGEVLREARKVVEETLKKFYTTGFASKYTLLVVGPNRLYGENLQEY